MINYEPDPQDAGPYRMTTKDGGVNNSVGFELKRPESFGLARGYRPLEKVGHSKSSVIFVTSQLTITDVELSCVAPWLETLGSSSKRPSKP